MYLTIAGAAGGAGQVQTREDLCAHRYVRGATGCGKSTWLAHLFNAACEAGDGAWWISTHGGESMLDVIPEARVKDVVYLAPASDRPLGFNLFKRYTCEAIEANLIADQTTRLFELLFERSWGDRIAEMVNAAALALVDWGEEATLFELYRMLTDERFRRRVLAGTQRLGVRDVLEADDKETKGVMARTAAKVRKSVTNSVLLTTLGQRNGLDLAELVKRRAIVVTDLDSGKLGEHTARFLAETLVSKLQMVAMSRTGREKPVHLFCDEFQTYPVRAFATLLSECRKKRMPVTLAHQEGEQLPKELRGAVLQVGSKYWFRQTPPDAYMAVKDFPKGRHTAEDFVALPNYTVIAKELVRGRVVYSRFRTAPPAPATGARDLVLGASQGPSREAVLAEIAGRGTRDQAEDDLEGLNLSGVVVRA